MFKGILFVILSGLLIYFVSEHWSKDLRKGNQYLTSTNNQLSVLLEEKVRHQKEIAQAIMQTQEAERKQLGEVLHDNIIQILATTKLYMDLAMENVSLRDDLMKKCSSNIIEVIAELRNLSGTLTPPLLGDIGLIASIEDLAQDVLKSMQYTFDLHIRDFNEEDVPHEKKLMIYRIIQEQIDNIIHHAEARRVQIWLSNMNGGVALTIQDDGKGFDVNKPVKGTGLKDIRNRVELFNGTFDLAASPGKGCTLSIMI